MTSPYREPAPCPDGECRHVYDDWPVGNVTQRDREFDQCSVCGWTEADCQRATMSRPAPPETTEQELARLSAELEMLRCLNAYGVPAEELARRQRRVQVISARISTVRAAWDREAWWRALSDQQRLELIDIGCRHCGSLDPRCYCQRDD